MGLSELTLGPAKWNKWNVEVFVQALRELVSKWTMTKGFLSVERGSKHNFLQSCLLPSKTIKCLSKTKFYSKAMMDQNCEKKKQQQQQLMYLSYPIENFCYGYIFSHHQGKVFQKVMIEATVVQDERGQV